MTLVNAIQVLFAKTAPAGADFEGASNALKGKKAEELSATEMSSLKRLTETFQDFTGDPTDWLRQASASDPRHSWWVKLAQALGASVSTSSGGSPSPSGSTEPVADSAVSEIEPEQGIDPDAFSGGASPPNRESGSGGGGENTAIVSGGGDERAERPKREKKRKDRDRDDKEKGAQPASKGEGGVPAQGVPVPVPVVAEPDLVQGFQANQDRGRSERALLREQAAAAKPETPIARRERLAEEAAELKRQLDADALERKRRQTEEEEALRRRNAIQAEADEARRMADLRLAAEKTRLDEEAQERRRLAEEQAAERRARREEEAADRKDRRDEERDARRAAPAKSPEPSGTKRVSSNIRLILQADVFKNHRAEILRLFPLAQAGDAAAQTTLDELERDLQRTIRSMPTEYMVMSSAVLAMDMIKSLRAGRNLSDDWFQANYLTGVYAN